MWALGMILFAMLHGQFPFYYGAPSPDSTPRRPTLILSLSLFFSQKSKLLITPYQMMAESQKIPNL
jgi:hypothetical protein